MEPCKNTTESARAPDAEQDWQASQVAYGVLLAAFAEHGLTLRAVRAAALAVIGSDAFEEDHAEPAPERR